MPRMIAFCAALLLLSRCALAEEPSWATAYRQPAMSADETRAFMKQLGRFVFDHHLKQTSDSPQRGMTYEYFDVRREGQFDQFVQGEALDTMHDGAWLAAAMVNAYRATGDEFYKEFLVEWQLPFYLKMLNHSDELFTSEHNHARPERQKTWGESKEWLLQKGEKGFVPYFWDDGSSVSLEMRKDKNPRLSFPGFDHFVHTGQANPQYRLHGYSLGSSNHMAQDLGVMLEQAWLLLRASTSEADRRLASEVALGAKHLHECRMRHHGYIPMCVAPATLAAGDAELLKRVPATDTPATWTPRNHYVTALYSFKPGQRHALPGFADDQEYVYYSGIARHGGRLPEPLAFKLIYDALTEPLLYRYYSDDAEVPPGINRFDLHPYYCIDGKLADYRSDRKGPSGKPRPIGSRMGPQNMICAGWALQALAAHPGIWERRYQTGFADDLRVFIADSIAGGAPPDASELRLGDNDLKLASTRHALRISGSSSKNELALTIYSGPMQQGSFARLTLHRDGSSVATNDRDETLLNECRIIPETTGFRFEIDLPYTVVKEQKRWANGIEHGRYSIAVGDASRNFYLASSETQIKALLARELAGGLRTWQAIFAEKGYIPTSIDAGFVWDEFSDSGGYAHLISAASQWLLFEANQRDWELQHVPDLLAVTDAADAPSAEEKERQRIARWEPQIAAFEKEDEKNPPPASGIVFVGSSSIRLWKLEESFEKLPVINRGFGGSQLADTVHYVDRLVLKHKPRTVVVYAGDNDLAGGKSPPKVADDFGELVRRIHDKLPKTRILYIGIKPSLKRWNLIEQVREANRLIAAQCQSNKRLKFIDVDPPMLNADGKPREELFLTDGLHLNAEGYKLWTSLVEPHLQEK